MKARLKNRHIRTLHDSEIYPETLGEPICINNQGFDHIDTVDEGHAYCVSSRY